MQAKEVAFAGCIFLTVSILGPSWQSFFKLTVGSVTTAASVPANSFSRLPLPLPIPFGGFEHSPLWHLQSLLPSLLPGYWQVCQFFPSIGFWFFFVSLQSFFQALDSFFSLLSCSGNSLAFFTLFNCISVLSIWFP